MFVGDSIGATGASQDSEHATTEPGHPMKRNYTQRNLGNSPDVVCLALREDGGNQGGKNGYA
jgi:hypothetical protein